MAILKTTTFLVLLLSTIVACSEEGSNGSAVREIRATAAFGPETPPRRIATGQCALPVSPDMWMREACMRCAADADMPLTRIDYRSQAAVIAGRYRLPSRESWHRSPTPRAVFGTVSPVLWRDLNVEDGMEICESATAESGLDRKHYGRLLHKAGDLAEAARLFKVELDALTGRTTIGVRASATYLGRMHEMGWGVPQDLVRAAALYETATGSDVSDDLEMYWPGHPRAQHNLASLRYWGRGIDQDASKAAGLWAEAARHHQVHATANMAWLYRRGEGVGRDVERSAELYLSAIRRLSLREDAPDLLVSNENRFGVFEPGADISIKWLLKAAEGNQREALVTLGYLYHFGKGVSADLQTALDYYERAVKLYGLSPEYSPGPAFVDAAEARVEEEKPAWVLSGALLDEGVEAGDPFALAMQGVYLERLVRFSDAVHRFLPAARQAYESSGLPNALSRSARLLLYEAATKQDVEREAALQEARMLLIAAAEGGHPGAQIDLAAVLNMSGAAHEAGRWVQKSLDATRNDFFYPDVRPLLVGGMQLDARDGAENSADAVFLFEEAERRAAFRGNSHLIPTIQEAKSVAQDSYRIEMAELVRQREAEEHVKTAIGFAIVFLVLSGMGGGGSQTSGGYMDMTDPMQYWGANMMMDIR